MIAPVLLWVALTGQSASPAPTEGETYKAYEAVKARTGASATDQVQLALWCEAHGLTAERLEHLNRAVAINPNEPAARGLLGQVSYNGEWLTPDEIQTAVANDAEVQAAMRDYIRLRAEAPDTAEAQDKLAHWCDDHHLTEQAVAHYKAVLRHDPRRDAVWKKLGYKKHGGSWVRIEELNAERAEAEAQKHADRYWKPKLERDREGLVSRDHRRRLHAEEALDAIDDLRAVPSIWSVFVRDDLRMQEHAARLFSQIDGRSASRAIAAMAVYSDFPEVRGRAAELLSKRDPRDFIDLFINLIHQPFNYEVKPLQGAGSRGGVFASGEKYNVLRAYSLSPMNMSIFPRRIFTGDVPYSPAVDPTLAPIMGWNGSSVPRVNGTPNLPAGLNALPGMAGALNAAGAGGGLSPRLQASIVNAERMAVQRDQQIAAVVARQQQIEANAAEALREDVARIEQTNQQITMLDDRVLPLITSLTGKDFGKDQEAWRKWWNNEMGYASESNTPKVKPTYTSFVAFGAALMPHTSCFAAGTPVRTIDGFKPIASLVAGDRVLSQDPTTGALSYQSVLVAHHNPPARLLKLAFDSETVLATGIHRFWKLGKGWTMARDLRPGDVVRTLGNAVTLRSTDPAAVAPVFNLDVAQNRDFFVGQTGFLVYDFSIVHSVAKPFDLAILKN